MRPTWPDRGSSPDEPTQRLIPADPGWTAPREGSLFPPEFFAFDDRAREIRRRRRRIRRLHQTIGYATGLIQGLLFVRFAFRLIGANPVAPATQWVLGLSDPFVYPFEGIFSTPHAGASALELHTLFAIAAYTVIGFGLKRLCAIWQDQVGRA